MRKASLSRIVIMMLLLAATAFLFAYNIKTSQSSNYNECKNDEDDEEQSDFMMLESITSHLYLLNK